jgi:anaerobic magnesium-protoporphyrin IX monomethyl ester cyclase
MRNPKLIVDEMEKYSSQYRVTDFHFEDLTAIVKKEKILQLAQEILDRGLKITFQLPSGTRSEAIDAQTARAIKAAGCSEFQFAPESGDARILKAIEKKINLAKMFEGARYAIHEGISLSCNFIFGFPEDDYKSVINNYKAIIKCARLGFTGVNLNAYSPQPNTASFRQLVKSGRIKQLDDDYFMSLFTFQSFFVKKTSYNDRFSSRQLTWLIFIGFLLFYVSYFALKPTRLYSSFRSFFTTNAANKSATYARSMLKETVRILRFRKLSRRAPLAAR